MHRLFFIISFLVRFIYSQTTPEQGLSDNRPSLVAYKNAVITISAENKKTANTIIVRDGRIEIVGNDIKIPAAAKIIDLQGAYIYPGFIEPFSQYGLTVLEKPNEVDGPNPDIKRVGEIHWNYAVRPQRSAAIEFMADEKIARELIAQGFTIVQSNGMDGFFQGSSVVVLLNQGLSNELILKDNSSQFLSFSRGSSVQDYPSSLMGATALIRQTLYDAQWYKTAWQAYQDNPAQDRPEKNISLHALQDVMEKKVPVIFDAGNYLNIFRAAKIADEFGLKFIYKGNSDCYKRIKELAQLRSAVIIPVNFPDAPNIASANTEADVSLAELKYWDTAPENPVRLQKAGIEFAFTSAGLEDKSQFLKNIRRAVQRGLDERAALQALTVVPAKMTGISHLAGTLEEGKLASFIITDKDIFDDNAVIEEVVIEKNSHVLTERPQTDFRGDWAVKVLQHPAFTKEIGLAITGNTHSLKAQTFTDSSKLKSDNFSVKGNLITFNVIMDTLNIKGVLRFNGWFSHERFSGKVIFPQGDVYSWLGERKNSYKEDAKDSVSVPEAEAASFPVTFPDKAYGRSAPAALPDIIAVTNGTVWTAAHDGIIEKGDIIIKKGKITAIGKNLPIPDNALKIDATGKHITPGIIDEHSHIAISGGVNEAGQAVSSEVRISDVVNPDNMNIYWQLTGGVTTSQLLHGSANPIGGQAQVIKLKWGEDAQGLKYKNAPPTIKFALGENVKQSNWGDKYTQRYPQTRMGVRELIWDAFKRAREYEAHHKVYNNLASDMRKRTIPPRKDLELDALVEILNSERFVHCHSYVQSEILMLMRLAEEYGFQITTFTHILEGYKVAKEMAEHGAMASAFADWWDYKFEVYEAIPYNTALMVKAGVVTSVNSDDAEMARRLNQEAAKTIKYGGLSREEAIKLVTINPARQLKIDKYTGSLEVGKEADFVVWNNDPLSIYAAVQQTWIEGRKYFDVEEDRMLRQQIKEQRALLIQKALRTKKQANIAEAQADIKQDENDYECNDINVYTGGRNDEN